MSRQGYRSDLTSCQVGTKLRTDEIIAENSTDSARQIQRYIRLTNLIPELLDNIAEKPLKFILFIDDLTFASDDRDFCALKATLEGRVSTRGSNTIIYVTSNHRHLIKESNADRQNETAINYYGNKIKETGRRQSLLPQILN